MCLPARNSQQSHSGQGSSQAGIFTSSASNGGVAESEAFGAGMGVASSARTGVGSVFLGAGSLSAISRILAAVSLRFCTFGSGVDAARGESFAAGSAKNNEERFSDRKK